MPDHTIFPQYRKYADGKTFFKILSNSEWEEVKVIGKHYSYHHFTVKIMPDRNYLHDLIYEYSAFYQVITENEYNEAKALLKV
ncbi:MAG: hypothetical protein M3R27_07810 [Bacteroidota bacterium]|nr:hypothetical protein [Bacteroidota bacterium]